MTQLTLPDSVQLARRLDPVTSVRAAAKAAKASRAMVRGLAGLIVASSPWQSTDEEAWKLMRLDGTVSQSTVRHARKALSDAGLLRDTGATRPTIDGGESRVWAVADYAGLRAVAETIGLEVSRAGD